MPHSEYEAAARERVARMPFWRGPVTPERLGGGITNLNFTVLDHGERYVVRVGDDILVHQIMRFNERAASEAAHAAGISPQVVHSEPGILVMRYIDGRTCTPEDIRDPARLAKILPLIKRVHRELPRHLRGPALAFWVFHVIRDYAHTLAGTSSRFASRLGDFVDVAADLELAVGPIDLVFGHNDLLAGNFIDDGQRIWLIDWDYAGFNSPLFDLANLCSNSDVSLESETHVLESYFERAVDADLLRRYHAMKCASLLREAMWSMVSELYLDAPGIDYVAYTEENLTRLEATLENYRTKYGIQKP